MKTYQITTGSNYEIRVKAINLKEAIKFGRRACKRDKETFSGAKLIVNSL